MKMTGFKEKQETQAKQHFFAASVHEWVQTTPHRDLPALIKMMERSGHGYNLFLVPLPHDAEYMINFYQPQVEGTQWLGYFEGRGESNSGGATRSTDCVDVRHRSMEMNTSELQGAALDWAVAKCEGLLCNGYEDDMGLIRIPSLENEYYAPSMKWAQGGPIIERDKLDVFCSGNVWDASTGDRHPNVIKTGPTPLIAAMRCYVASKLGDEIELPEELQ